MFGVTERYVYQLLSLRRETGDLAPQPHCGGAKPKLDERHLLKLAELIAEFPDATLAELGELAAPPWPSQCLHQHGLARARAD